MILEDGKPTEWVHDLNDHVLEVVAGLPFTPLAIEMVSHYGPDIHPGKDVFETCVWIGRFIEAHGGEATRIYRHQVKKLLIGTGAAKDSNIRQALIDRWGGREKAIGGVKCSGCKGKAGRRCPQCHGGSKKRLACRRCRGGIGMSGPDGRVPCWDCDGSGWLHPPGLLHGITGDVWQALAVAVCYAEMHEGAMDSGAPV
jgi:hypothetical protein